MALIPIGILWNIYLEYAKYKNEINQLREDLEKMKKMIENGSSDDNQ